MAEVVPFPQSDVEPGTQSDADAREQALNIRASCIVEAPAGSGKTGLLVQRYLKLLADENVAAPEEVLAVTFTRKATAELRNRVLEQLLAAQQGEPLPAGAKPFDRTSRELAVAALVRSRQLNWQLLEQPLRLNINTFDAVAMQIANALPLLSGSGGPREPVENAAPLYRAAARRTLLQLGSKDRTLHDALHRLLLHRDGNLADCETLIAEMLGSREQWGELVPLDRELDHEMLDTEVRPKLEHALEAIVTAGLQRALATMPAGVLEYLAAFAHRFADLPGHNDKPSPIANCLGRPTPPEAIAAHFDHWCALIGLVLKPSDGEWRSSLAVSTLGFKPPKKDLDDHKAFIASIQSDRLQAALASIPRLPPARYPDEQWEIAKALFFVLRHALAELKVLFARRGECDFTELALAAREALRSADADDAEGHSSENSASDLALASGGRLRHLLIDEMQDTSAGQYELIQLLTRSWDGATQTLFLVGDPKQSIYLFRAARIERFQRTFQEGRLGEIQLAALSLTANFRSQATLVEGFNRSFEPLFLKRGDPQTEAMDVHFVAATAKRPETQPKGILWHTSVLGEEPLPPGMEHAELEARILRSVIERRLALPLPADRKLQPNGRPAPWRIAVLGHGRKHLSAVVKELQRAKLPFKAIDIDPLAERPEVQDALALTRALLHPADRIAWLAVLHAPWCGLGLADLLSLTGDGIDATTTVTTLVDNHRSRLSPQGQQLLDRAWPVLHAAVSTLGRTSLAVHVERTWRSLGGDAALTPEQQTNVLRYLAALREVEADGARVDLDVLTSRLNSLYAEPFAGECHIELLTIHKSKGLEWDVVLVPGLERGSGRSSTPLLNWLEFDPASAAHDAAVILAPIGSKGTGQGALGQWLNNLRRQRELAERKRLFYVACTRAQEELHLFAAVERKQDDSFAEPHHASLLKACWPAAAAPFARMNQAELSEDVAVANNEAEFESIYNGHYGNGHYGDDIALAAEASETAAPSAPTLQRLPLSFDPAERFITAYARRLDYPPAATLQRAPSFDRPEGSFAVRAFGNVVHRYLQLLATRLMTTEANKLQAELPSWQSRLETSLRGEGLPPTVAAREATRALRALTLTLGDPVGLWILSPHAGAASESGLTAADAAVRSFRVDRTFLAGPETLSTGESCIWIVDFKTTEQGARSDAAFAASEMEKYRDQLETYADLRRALPDGHLHVRLGLYYPLIPRLLSWDSESERPG
jgi:ATP-dependent exoDNAse (exonuclease V) beta subunit